MEFCRNTGSRSCRRRAGRGTGYGAGPCRQRSTAVHVGRRRGPRPAHWREFCAQYAPECETPAMPGRDAVLTTQAWNDLLRINEWVNDTVKPMTDLEHWGVA